VGLFSDIGSFFGTAAKAITTGGISLIAPKLIPKFIDRPLTALTTAQFPTSLKGALQTGLAVATRNPALLLPSPTFGHFGPQPEQHRFTQGGQPMALNIGGILQGVSGIFGGGQNQLFQGVSNVAGLASQFFPQGVAQPVAQRMPMAGVPMVLPRGLARVGGAVGRRFFDKYPNLATAIQGFRDRGQNVKRGWLYSMLKRFGPDILITGGILSAAAIAELMMAGPGHRRMNVGNAKALRRCLRRLEGFHKLCVRADQFRGSRKRGKACKTRTGQQFVRQG